MLTARGQVFPKLHRVRFRERPEQEQFVNAF